MNIKDLSDPETRRLIARIASSGVPNKTIAYMLGIKHTDLNNKLRDPGLKDLIDSARKTAELRVEASLLKRACGYEYSETKYFKQGSRISKRKIKRHVPPSPTALKYWVYHVYPITDYPVSDGFDVKVIEVATGKELNWDEEKKEYVGSDHVTEETER